MKKIRICFNYRHISEPWGGANNFIRALHHELMESGEFEFVDCIEDDYDILFMNELGMGPANGSKRIALKKVKSLLNQTGIKMKNCC